MIKHWRRLKRSLSRRWKEWRLPRGYERFGTRYGGWWIDTRLVSEAPLLIDCGLGRDISFPRAFLQRFPGARVIGVDPNPDSIAYCRASCPAGMEIVEAAFWLSRDEPIVFHLPRPVEQLPKGADGVSGSLDASHEYVAGGKKIETRTIDLDRLLVIACRSFCDVLKLDIEGAEYAVLDGLLAQNLAHKARQLLIEFHHGVTHHSMQDTLAVLRRLQEAGYKLMHVEGRNYILCCVSKP